jgi:hypothetical protein
MRRLDPQAIERSVAEYRAGGTGAEVAERNGLAPEAVCFNSPRRLLSDLLAFQTNGSLGTPCA